MEQEGYRNGWINSKDGRARARIAPTLMSEAEKFIEGKFNPEDVETLGRAYRQALHMLGRDDIDAAQKSSLAKYLMEIARTGEVDAARLSSMAVRRMLGHQPTPEADGE